MLVKGFFRIITRSYVFFTYAGTVLFGYFFLFCRSTKKM